MRIFGLSMDDLLPWRVARRIRILSLVLDRIGKGDFSQQAPGPSSKRDAVGNLGSKINDIAVSLVEQIEKLKYELIQFEMLIDTMSEGVVVTNADGIVILANPAWYDIFSSSPKCLGQPLLESVRVPQIFDSIKTSMKTHRKSEEEFCIGDRFFIARTAPFGSDNDKGCVTVVNDITKIKQLETMRRDFTANISHQMKTPLTSILGYTETLLNGALSDKETSNQFILTIRDQSLKLKALIDDILQLAKIESGAHSRQESDLDVGELLNELVLEFRNNRKNIAVNFLQTKANVRTDKKSVEHIIRNLLDNSIKYTPPGGAVNVLLKDDEDSASISIEDNGAGIDSGNLDRIFERFYRIDRTGAMDGSGLGLAIAKHLSNKLGATISVESEIGKGSIFNLILPKSI